MSAAYWLPGTTEKLKRATSGVMEAGQALSALLLERRPGASIKTDYVEHDVFKSVACVIMDGLDVAAIASFDLPRGRAWFSVEDANEGGTAFFVDVRQAANMIIGDIELCEAPVAITDRGPNPEASVATTFPICAGASAGSPVTVRFTCR